MNLLFSNPVGDAIAPFIAERLRQAIANIDELRGEKTLYFATKSVEEAEGSGDAQPRCLALFTLIGDDSKRRFPIPMPEADTCSGFLHYSLTDAVYGYPTLHVQATGLGEFCRLITERLIAAFTEG